MDQTRWCDSTPRVSESGGLALVFRHEGDHVTTLLERKDSSSGWGPKWGSLRCSFIAPPHVSQRGGTSADVENDRISIT